MIIDCGKTIPTLIVNLFGGPGSGKSTGAAYIFSKLKMLGVNVELVTEFAKDKVWEESVEVFKNQIYIFGKQYFKITKCVNKVDVIVTDSPLLNSILYNSYESELFEQLVKEKHDSFENINFFIRRKKEYNPIGRFQSETQAFNKEIECFEMLNKLDLEFFVEDGTINGYDSIVSQILNILK